MTTMLQHPTTTLLLSSSSSVSSPFFSLYPRAAPLLLTPCMPSTWHHHHRPSRALRVSKNNNDSSIITTTTTTTKTADDADATEPERSEADKLVDGVDFGELCNDFECISSPSVESTARQLARDIMELREGNRAIGTYAVSVKYKDPLRAFTGREKYKRPLWVMDALENPSVTVQEMVMLSTSVLSIKWTVRGRPKSFLASIGGDLIIKVNSQFTLNQISGQVIEHEEFWDLSASSAIAQAYFWISRRLFSTKEAGKDVAESIKNVTNRFPLEKDPDPSGDPTKFFQRDDEFQRDAYQVALFLAVLYFVVQFLRTTL